MKKRDIFLDFTSLLDVTLIIIFFFVIFSHLDGEKQEKAYESKMAEYESIMEKNDEKESYDTKESELVAMESKIKEEYKALEDEKNKFGTGKNIKIVLNMDGNSWYVVIKKGEEIIDNIKDYQNISSCLPKTIEKMGYDIEDVIFCEFIYDGSAPGTKKACSEISKGMEEIKKIYINIYVSETDISDGLQDSNIGSETESIELESGESESIELESGESESGADELQSTENDNDKDEKQNRVSE